MESHYSDDSHDNDALLNNLPKSELENATINIPEQKVINEKDQEIPTEKHGFATNLKEQASLPLEGKTIITQSKKISHDICNTSHSRKQEKTIINPFHKRVFMMEKILSFLEPKDLLEKQLVCKHWYENTIPLAMKTFLLDIEVELEKLFPEIVDDENNCRVEYKNRVSSLKCRQVQYYTTHFTNYNFINLSDFMKLTLRVPGYVADEINRNEQNKIKTTKYLNIYIGKKEMHHHVDTYNMLPMKIIVTTRLGAEDSHDQDKPMREFIFAEEYVFGLPIYHNNPILGLKKLLNHLNKNHELNPIYPWRPEEDQDTSSDDGDMMRYSRVTTRSDLISNIKIIETNGEITKDTKMILEDRQGKTIFKILGVSKFGDHDMNYNLILEDTNT